MELTIKDVRVTVEELLKDAFEPIVSQINFLTEEVRTIKLDVKDLKVQVADVQDTLSDLVRAEEKDAEASSNHELRIQRLERLSNIESMPPAHLAEIE